MKNFTESTELHRGFARACITGKLYWGVTIRTTAGGKASLSYSGAASFHHTLEGALSWIESARTRGSRFELREVPALYFPPDLRRGNLHRGRGLVVAEVNSNAPFATCGAMSLNTLDLFSVGDQFTARGADFCAMEAPAEIPGLGGELLAWRSRVFSSRYKLRWSQIAGVQWDLSHIQSLCMRLDQEVRNTRDAAAASA